MNKSTILVATALIVFAAMGCKQDDTATPGTTTPTVTDYSAVVQKAFTSYGSKSVTSVTVDGDYVVIKATGVTDHKSPYLRVQIGKASFCLSKPPVAIKHPGKPV